MLSMVNTSYNYILWIILNHYCTYFGSGLGFGACLPIFLSFLLSGKGFLSIMTSWFLIPAGRGFCSIMISWFLLVPALARVLVSFLSFFFSSSGKGFFSIMVSWFLLVLAGVPGVVSRILPSFFSLVSEKGPATNFNEQKRHVWKHGSLLFGVAGVTAARNGMYRLRVDTWPLLTEVQQGEAKHGISVKTCSLLLIYFWLLSLYLHTLLILCWLLL